MMLMSIAAMATDPAVIAVSGTIGGGLFLKMVEGHLSKPKAAVPVPVDPEEARIEGLARAILEDDSFGGCTLEYQRAFEQTLIDAGIKTELSVCYDERCETCHPKTEAPEIGTVGKQKEVQCNLCGRYETYKGLGRRKPSPFTCRDCAKERAQIHINRAESLKKKKQEAKAAFDKSRGARTANVSGRIVPIPNNVPKYATAHVEYDMHAEMSVVWTWDVDGKTMYFRQRTSPEMLDSFPLAPKEIVSPTVPLAGSIRAGDTWIHSGGTSKCEPCDEPVFSKGDYNYKRSLRAHEYEIKQQQKRIQELDRKMDLYKNNITNLNEMRKSLDEYY